ncbi:MAG TPA: nucleoside deaminase [Terriglobales bacterium]|nr:nucleoside deaminase [Terriglobales bacterium]
MTNSFMQRAIDLSIENVQKSNGGPFGAVVVKDNRILAEGTNSVVKRSDPTAHAEIVAVREACRKLNSFQLTGCEIYSSCEPCPMCLAALYWARPAKIFYAGTRNDAAEIGFDDTYIYAQLMLPVERRAIPMKQLMRDQAQEAYRRWKAKPNKKQY